MNKANVLCAGMILLISCSAVWADLSTEFSGYTWVKENKVSGLKSSIETAKIPSSMFTLGPDRVSYPGSIGTVPSPGGSTGQHFDEGGLGVKVQGGNLILRVAGGLDPLNGWYYSHYKTWYSQGDVFITVDDSQAGVKNFALLNSWPTDGTDYLELDGGHYDDAQKFHTLGGAGGTSLEGHLVSLSSNNHVVFFGGTGAYTPGTVDGLDSRAYAQGGTNIGNAGLVHITTTDEGLVNPNQTWYIQTWTFPTNWLSSDPVFTIGLHKVASCGNDQIGMVTVVPAPGALVLGLAGFGTMGFVGKIARTGRRKAEKLAFKTGNSFAEAGSLR